MTRKPKRVPRWFMPTVLMGATSAGAALALLLASATE
jgi:hypothetical protein